MNIILHNIYTEFYIVFLYIYIISFYIFENNQISDKINLSQNLWATGHPALCISASAIENPI